MPHHHGGAGSPYTASTTADAFSLPSPPTDPISFASIQQPPTQLQPAGTSAFAELPLHGSAGGGGVATDLHDDDDDMPADVGASETGDGASGSGSSRWPREETLALLRIRSEMDAAFRNAPLKAPLWEDVSRKLAELGYRRDAKKCKEKFDNVDKYYRRTKEARAGRQAGKSYHFFSELDALHALHAAAPQWQQQGAVQPDPQPSAAMAWTAGPSTGLAPSGSSLPGLSFSLLSETESESDDEFDVADAEDPGKGDGKCDKEMMALFEGMTRRVTEKQDAMQRVFLEALDRWETERMAREEAWRLQEVARMNREREQLARERAAAAARDAALVAFLQRVGGGHLPPPSAVSVPAPPMPDSAPPSSPRQDASTSMLQVPPKSEEAWAWAWAGGESSGGSSSSRWPKEEVHALIQLRTEKEEQYQDTGSKGVLWEDIAAGMRRIGYNRNAKRCKEKWENINKYFKKVKESNKRRPEDSKTCPYFHQLDAMYRKKQFAGGGSSSASGAHMTAVTGTASGQASPSQRELERKSSNDVGKQKNVVEVANVHAPLGNNETAPTTTDIGDGAKSSKKAEGTVGETNVQLQQQQQQEFAAEETESDDTEDNYTGEGTDGDRMQSETGFQKPNVAGSSGNTPALTETAAAATSSAPTSSTFPAVQ